MLIGIAVYIILTVVTGYKVNWVQTNSTFLTNIFVRRYDLDLQELIYNHSSQLFLANAINSTYKFPFMLLGYRCGVKRCENDRSKLHSGK